jgi:hypothetical protein
MNSSVPDPRLDRLYDLLPVLYRMRDAQGKFPLRALLSVLSEQLNLVEDDITRLYENWFIETAEDWAVPYVADLIGYRPVHDAGTAADGTTPEGRALNRVLIPRREVANTIRYRRRKGTLALLELLANDVAGWPARAVEFFKLLGWSQNINHLHLDRARTVSVRRQECLDQVDGPFDSLAHTVDVRRINSHRTAGRYNIPTVAVFVWRLRPYSVTRTSACCDEGAGPHCLTFSVLGQDTPLFIKPEPEADAAHIADLLNVPAPISRRAFKKAPGRFYGKGKSLAVWAEGWAGFDPDEPLPVSALIAADLSEWQYVPPPKHVALDPVLGRLAFPSGQLPKKGVRVSYHYAFSADLGGGEYGRDMFDPAGRTVNAPNPADATKEIRIASVAKTYRVGIGQKFQKIGDALKQRSQDAPDDAVIELTDSAVYVEPLSLTLEAGKTLQIRAANGKRPVIRLLDWQTELPDALSVTMGRGSRFTLDGLLVTGRPLQVTGPERPTSEDARMPICVSEVVIRHCTLVPGWGIDCECEPLRPAEPSLEVFNLRARVCIEHSILGSIAINEDEVNSEPIPLHISDSILDATDLEKEAIGAPGLAVAHAILTMRRCTVFGIVDVRAIEVADDCIFLGCLNVARRQLGCMRFCYVPAGCRTPRRYHCQPDLVEQAVKNKIKDLVGSERTIRCERLRVRPQFTSSRYGNPGYAQLSLTCAAEIRRGAEDESEMGAFHDLFQPQREANLRARLEEFTPAEMEVGIVFAT